MIHQTELLHLAQVAVKLSGLPLSVSGTPHPGDALLPSIRVGRVIVWNRPKPHKKMNGAKNSPKATPLWQTTLTYEDEDGDPVEMEMQNFESVARAVSHSVCINVLWEIEEAVEAEAESLNIK